jgi:hypothetical protein
MVALRVPRILKILAILLIVAVGLIHLIGAPQHYRAAPYIGVLFVANFVGSLVSAFGIYRDALWGWLLGILIAGGAFVAYVVSRSIGLPGFEHAIGRWSGPMGVFSLVVEALFVALFVSAVAVWRRHES